MARPKKELLLTIEQSGKVFHHRLGNTIFTVGRHSDNDITIHSEQYPNKHTLFAKKNNHYQLRLKKFMKGEVVARNSRLTFHDMIEHELLPHKRDSFCYPITNDKKGCVHIGDAKISFQIVKPQPKQTDPAIRDFNGYSWALASLKDLGRDLPFKGILLVFIVLHGFLLSYMSKLPVDIQPQTRAPKVPDRFARIIVKNPSAGTGDIKGVAGKKAGTKETAKKEAKRERSEKGSEKVRPESQGVLGLLTGTGNTGQSSQLTDFLLDKGLAKELDDIMEVSDLQVGKGTNDGDIDFEALVATSELGGGIDDIIEEADEVESVDLGEKGQIQVDQVGSITGSEEAVGKRSEESVRSIMSSHQGRLTYIYNKYLKRNPELRGKLVVEVEIAANGRVSNVKLVSSSMGHPEFEREILNFIRRWRYEPIDAGMVTVTYPLFFSKME
ncbi:energy transducer TonB [candidate division KSB1 bacterium]|nr:energy transducer TonB [candidate division KSB1 bacterium]NIR71728.1 energy transducer TonB [candidate division KSB1 bacterium]NIS26409.1 energy transducer TonB [candidate division KSB1 bacterium]NIT73168.1 energy transducer TonB [candidate division KSB1 bacterium]NIU27095.1 energy transducer TonB [candidate division KSB1 bacterium]